MSQVSAHLSTGLPGLDQALKGLAPGDNIVWQVDTIDDYAPFVAPYCESARASGRQLVYFRFGKHRALVPESAGAEVLRLHPEAGFETFIMEVYTMIEKAGRGAFYVFDCLSELAVDWYSDRMLGNFFMLTCPYLYDLETVAYFAVLRNRHSSEAITPIVETTQLFLDVYRHKERLCVHPIKVQQRYSPTMFMLHVWEGEQFPPVTDSTTIAEILTSAPWQGLEAAHYRLGVWNRAFLQAEQVLEAQRQGTCLPADPDGLFRRLVRMAICREGRLLGLIERYLSLEDVVAVRKRMIGTGLIGGKAVGMFLARAILKQKKRRWVDLLEPHDSFYIGSDVFYTFLVRNGIWWMRQRQRDPATFLDGAEKARQRMLMGRFPDDILKQFSAMLDYFGQSPIIVRSSSLLEDNFGNAFAGKYESVFCPNQGPHQKRLEDFLSAVRMIYASTMGEKALRYRSQRGILDRDEQMALLVQRVSGRAYGDLFFPQVAGVAFSVNPYVWSEYIDPKAGMLRLVFGLGTRAVDRSDDDYTRVVALNAPERRPESHFDEVRQYAQRRVDFLDLQADQKASADLGEVAHRSPGLPIGMFAARDAELERRAEESGIRDACPWVLTFDRFFAQTAFISDMREMMGILQEAYDYPVDVEFTANVTGSDYRLNLVQCRPLQVKGGGAITDPPPDLAPDDAVLEAYGAVIGQSRLIEIRRFIYVVPSVYGNLSIQDRYAVARLIGQVTRLDGGAESRTTMLLGPGRWGTTTPSLGVPVSFADISTVSVLCEVVAMRDDLVPDVSLGTHFLNDLIELDILYMALFPTRKDNRLDTRFFEGSPNRFAELLPEAAAWARAIRVIDVPAGPDGAVYRLNANTLKQRVVCYADRGGRR